MLKRNLRFLAYEMFKLNSGMAPELIKKLILPNRQHWYELRNNPDFSVQVVKSVHKCLESFLGKWNPQSCPSCLCRAYLQNDELI